MPESRSELVRFQVDGVGPVIAVLPTIPEDAPYRVREGIARRRLVALTGQCPCGAQLDLYAAREGRSQGTDVEHRQLCPAVTHRLEKAIRRWAR